MEKARLIVGLGNPGAQYARTRHNVGFQLVERLATGWQAAWKLEKKFNATVAQAAWHGQGLLLARPETFMNCSGDAVGALTEYFRVPLDRVLVAVDDADLPLGQIRLRARGSSGGHHGLESIEQRVGSRDFPRLRIGIGRTDDGRREIADYVLAPFAKVETALLDAVLAAAASQVECWVDDGIEKAMNRFNGTAGGPGDDRKTK
jgi:PTH1 family peptidyl-tRNA hydrolase